MSLHRCAFSMCALSIVAATPFGLARTIQEAGGKSRSVRIAGVVQDEDKIPIAGATIGIATWQMKIRQPPFGRTIFGPINLDE